MVSTRQMATSGGGNNGGTLNHNAAAATLDSARLTTTTLATQQTQRGSMVAAPIISTIIATTGVVATTSRNARQCHGQNYQNSHQQQQQLIKMGDNIIAGGRQKIISEMHLFDLPIEILAKIFAYTGFRKVGQLRVVSRRMNDVCMDILNSTFSRLITQTYNRFHAIKANMPRRESARRNHPLACECDIIETCYMRLSLLQMTFGKHIERGHCCFFPGAILDEVYNILNYIRNTPRLERPYRVTDELFDLSTMAMEYFRDRIEETLPDIAYFNKDFFKLPTTTKRPALVTSVDHSDNTSTSPPQSNMVLRKGIRKIKQGMKIYSNQLSVLRNELRNCKRKSSEQGKQIAEQQKLLAEQQKQTLEYANRLDENDKKNEEMARKFSTLLQELNKCKTELQYWRSKSPAIPICTSCGQKLAPLLPPPEDFQALVNQGVKPEDIILNLSDDTDIETDAGNSMSEGCNEHGKISATTTTIATPTSAIATTGTTQSSQASLFAFPDKETTAKLLAVSNTITKNQLKRQHYNNNSFSSSSSSLSSTITSNKNDGSSSSNNSAFHNYAGVNNGGGGSCYNCSLHGSGNGDNQSIAGGSGAAAEYGSTANSADNNYQRNDQLLPSEMTNRLNYVRGSNIIRTTASAANCSNWYNLEQQATEALNCAPNLSSNEHVPNMKQASVLGNRLHRSVIVSPAMLSVNKRMHDNLNSASAECLQATQVNVEQFGGSDAAKLNGVGVGVVSAEESAVEHVTSLQGITSHETKKARRVQKATRCLNGSGKRSKY